MRAVVDRLVRLRIAFLLLACSGGCREIPIARGPEFRLPEMTTAASGIVQTGGAADAGGAMPLDFKDHRPIWEKRYHAAAEDPCAWKRAVGFVSMENMRPSMKDRIIEVVNQSAGSMSERPTWGVFHLDSFRVVVNNSEHKHREYEARQKELELELERQRSGFMLGVSDSGGVGIGVGFGTGSLERRPGLRPPHPTYSDADPLVVPSYRIVNGEKELVGPPKELPLKYGPGVTCEIACRVELYWSGGRTHELRVEASQYVLAPEWGVYDMTTDVPKAVQGALADLSDKLVRDASTFLGTSPNVPPAPTEPERLE